ncbi:MAG: hypothetical protein IKL23_07365, partial [Oscillospiraceae bacterium]|nr:hypothetical protein [Oscillospiraceae bacterium]
MLLIKNAYIKTMVSPDLENGCILLDDAGKIAAVGEEIAAPEGCTVIDAEGRLVTPGCVDAHCHIGLDNEAMGWEGMDYNEIVVHSVVLDLDDDHHVAAVSVDVQMHCAAHHFGHIHVTGNTA